VLLEGMVFLLLLLCLLATGTRGGILALGLTAPIILLASPISTRLKIIATISAFLVVSVGLFIMRDLILNRLVETTLGSQSIAYRIDAWQIGWQAIWERPWLGWGSDNFLVIFGQFGSAIQIPKETFDTAHNHLIAIAVGSGLIGLSLYFAVLGLTLVKLIDVVRGSDEIAKGNALLAAAAIISYQIASIFIFETIIAQPIYYLAIAYALMRSRTRVDFKAKWNTLILGIAAVLALAVIVNETAFWKSAERLRTVESSSDWTAKIAAARQETGGVRQEELLYLFSMETWQDWLMLSTQEKQSVRAVLDQLLIDSNIETLNWRTTFHLANAYLRMVSEYPDLQKSLKLLVDRTYQLAPLRPQSTRLLANYFIISGQTDRARQVLERYLEKNPDRPIMRTMLNELAI
jgi:O-antigen ligase